MKKVFLIFLTTLFCFNGFTQEISDETTDSIDEETQRNLKEARRNLSELFLIMTEELKTPADGESVPESALELTDDEKIEMAAELLELPVETVRRFAAEQKEPAAEETPAGETKVKSFISDKPLTAYRSGSETVEIPAGTLFTTEEELESYAERFDGKRIVLTAKMANYRYDIVECKSGTEITLRSESGYEARPVFSVWGVLLPPSDFYPYARIVDAVFIVF